MKLIVTLYLLSLMNLTQGYNNQLIIFIATEETNSSVQAQIDLLKKAPYKLKERKLAVFTLIDGKVSPIFNAQQGSEAFVEKNQKRYSSSSFKMHLVGLDQSIKETYSDLAEPGEIFKLIDSMPMRRAEMRKN